MLRAVAMGVHSPNRASSRGSRFASGNGAIRTQRIKRAVRSDAGSSERWSTKRMRSIPGGRGRSADSAEHQEAGASTGAQGVAGVRPVHRGRDGSGGGSIAERVVALVRSVDEMDKQALVSGGGGGEQMVTVVEA